MDIIIMKLYSPSSSSFTVGSIFGLRRRHLTMANEEGNPPSSPSPSPSTKLLLVQNPPLSRASTSSDPPLPEVSPISTALLSSSSSPATFPSTQTFDSRKDPELTPSQVPILLTAPVALVVTPNLDGKQNIGDMGFVSTLNRPEKPHPTALPVKKLSYKAVVQADLQLLNAINPSVDKDEENRRFPWAARMNPSLRNLYRATTPTYLEDGTPKVSIPSHVLLKGLENQKEFIIGQFYRCSIPSGGLTHAVVNRIWGRKCKIFTRKLSDSSYLFHIPDDTTRSWVLQRGLWHVDHCLMFVAPWSPTSTLSMPEITTVPVWVTLKNIPNQLYSISGISHIVSGLGAPMATSKPRLDPTLMGEAKILVEVELDKPFPQKIAASDKTGSLSMVDVEYSWIPSKCGRCGHLGHKESRCLQPSPMPQVKATTLKSLHPSSGVHDSSPPKIEVALPTISSSGTEIATASISSFDVVSRFISTPQIETTIATRNDCSLLLGSNETSSIEEGPITFISETLEPTIYCDVVAPTTNISDVVLTTETTPLRITDLSVVATHVTSSTLPPLDDIFVRDPNGAIVTPESSDTDVDLVAPSSQRILRDRPVHPSLKYNENEWISVSTCRRSKRSRGRRGKFD